MSKAPKSDDALLLALACGMSAEQAARQAGVSAATPRRRLHDAAFGARMAELRHEMLSRAAAMLTAAGVESVRTLVDLLKPTNGPTVRLNAARSILEQGVRLRSLVEVEERLRSLEERVEQADAATGKSAGGW